MVSTGDFLSKFRGFCIFISFPWYQKMYVLTKNKESVSAYIPNIICFAFCTFSDNARWAQDIPWLDTSMVLLILQALSISASQFRSLASSTCQIISPLESHPVLHTRPCLVALCKVFESKFFIVEVLNIRLINLSLVHVYCRFTIAFYCLIMV